MNMSIINKLTRKMIGVETPRFNITQQANGTYYFKTDEYKFIITKNIPSKRLLETTIAHELSKGYSILEIKRYLSEKWGSTKQKGWRFEKYVENGKYVGSMEFVKFKIVNTNDPLISKILCFIPWYGNIHLTRFYNTEYDAIRLKETTSHLFSKTKVLYVPKLLDKTYKHFKNHKFVKYVTPAELEAICKENKVSYDIKLKKQYDQTAYLREELNNAQRKITALQIECNHVKQEKDTLQADLNELINLEEEKISAQRKRKSLKRGPAREFKLKKNYHWLGNGMAKKYNRAPGFYLVKSLKPLKYVNKGYRIDSPIPVLRAFKYHNDGYDVNFILHNVPDLFPNVIQRYSTVYSLLKRYDEGAFEYAIKFIVDSYGLDSSYLNLINYEKVPTL